MARLVIGTSTVKTVPAKVVSPRYYREFELTQQGKLIPSTTVSYIMDFTGVKSIDTETVCNMYKDNTNISGPVNLSSIENINSSSQFYGMFNGCTGITSVDLGNATSATGSYSLAYMFKGCTSLTTADLHSLVNATGNQCFLSTFEGCTNLVSLDLSSLQSLYADRGAYTMCYSCSSLTSIKFPSLNNINYRYALGSSFGYCTNLRTLSFYALSGASVGNTTSKSQFNNTLNHVTGCTVHFPIRMQSVIGDWTDITNGMGGIDTVILFDIVTELVGVNGNTYVRQEKDSTSTATAWINNSNLYYTAGINEPTVGATIYSDSTCTTTVTTVSSLS